MFGKIIFGIAILQVVWAAAETCTEATSDSQSGKCKQNMCNVWIGGSNFCSQCSTAAEHLVNGKCITTGEDAEGACTTKNDGTCTSCKAGFFLHRGGCYEMGSDIGLLVCNDRTATADKDGICIACHDGYFKNPASDADKTKESCIACNNTAGVDHNKGVQNCATCDAPKTPGQSSAEQTATCKSCVDGYYGTTSCQQCHADCRTCTGNGEDKCTSCKDTGKQYFKEGANSDGTGTCVDENGCGNTHFPIAEDKKCHLCGSVSEGGVADCKTCSKTGDSVKCLTCEGTKKPNEAGTGCFVCPMEHCEKCSKDNVCEACGSEKKLSPLGDACLDACPAGTRTDANVCNLCHESCASCSTNAEASCTACYPGYVLNRSSDDTGTCIKECTGDFMAHCKADGCSLNVGGSKYCDQCEEGYAPVDGVCTSIPATARDASGCKASGGKCTECGANYALLSGGCYNTQKLPGSSVCTAAQNKGQCQTCANGQTYADKNCPTCTEGCVKCAGSKETCTDCLAGYYKTIDNKCVKCTASSGDNNQITGVENCISCAPPAGGSGPVTCYVTQQKADDGTGGDTGGDSTNRSGLSTGAIAGISVAVVAVVGGLVGFLCWWFVCRGKA
ncbi:VSP AS8 [Giardia duodenalis]|uniref:VSP AS8 n=1 Tax=Giardia intestinalis (strain ATCC 50803 / WB clone C6) TaxID=184922 RepID=A0A644F438_GIAIC|nr:VSP AS8 [Giardia intestinalis]KAE8303365.1 VSP AS8 [Giardia intestinalis]